MQPQRAPPPSASASLAASKAFIKNAESNGDLSSAAAAAALRTHVTTPTPVGETVTKRMVRRGSHSSNGSSSRQSAGPLQRQSSSASMTERSFRAPSPGRGSPADINAPPVPPVPKNIAEQSVAHRRASSLDPTYRGGSPAPRGSGRGVSLDRGGSIGGAARGQRPATSHLAQLSEEEEASRSINFSRPMSPALAATKQNAAPPASKGWFGGPVVNQDAIQRMASTSRPMTSSGVSSLDRQAVQRSVQNAAERPVRTHQIAQGVQGSRLSSGSMRAKPSGTAIQSQSYVPRQAPRPVDPNSPDAIYDPSTRKFIHKQDAMARHRELHEESEPAQQHVDSFQPNRIIQDHQMGRGSPSPIRQNIRQAQPAPQRREEPVPQLPVASKASDPVHQQTVFDAPQPQDTAFDARRSEDFADADVEPQEQSETVQTLADSGYGTIAGHDDDVDSPIVAGNQDSAYPQLLAPANDGRRGGSLRDGHDRNASLSPPRNAHFAAVTVELAMTKHDPLPRSVSPAKSALKSSPSVSRRGESPAVSTGRHSGWGVSSDVSDTASDDGTRKKKKNVRVSFEEDPVVVAHVDSEAPPQRGLGASRWSPIAEKEDEFEAFMKPRPALPSFGSIREKERRPQEDMAEKVTETVSTSPMSSSKDPQQVSSDVALGSIVAQDLAQKQMASNDPLPPDVTTVEGSGYASDSSDDSDSYKPMDTREKPHEPHAVGPKSPSPLHVAMPSTTAPITEQFVDVPNIALQPATPSPYEKPEPELQSLTIPGGWDESAESGPTRFTQSAPDAQPQPTTQIDDDGETTDDSSIYSDAYEDLSDGEGGFGSIDALMTKPSLPPSGMTRATETATEKSTLKPKDELVAYDSEDSDATATPMQDWNAASQHWSGVSASLKQPQNASAAVERRPDAQQTVAPVPHERVTPAASSEHATETTPERKIAATEPPRTSTPLATQSPAKPLKSALKKSPAQPARQVEPQNRTPQTHMKRTMRGSTNAPQSEPQMGSTMRTSMRGPAESPSKAPPKLRQSMRSADTSSPPGMGLAASRHSMIPMDTKPRGALQKKNIPPAAATRQARPQSMPAARPKTAPAVTYDSDSDASTSSFQRTRKRGSREQSGRYTMRASMRQEPTPTLRMSVPVPRQVRAISPAGSPSPAMRRSMRSASPIQEPARSSKFSIRSLSPMGRFRKGSDALTPSPVQQKPMPSFAKQQKPAKQTAPPAKPTKTPFKSRIVDSSDEDEDDRPSRFQSRFQSRFEDSDSDDVVDYKLPPGLTPVRGIPRKAGEEDGDSTDLEEEAEEDAPKVVPQSAVATNGTNGAQGVALSTGSLRDSKHAPLPSFEAGTKTKTKRGFLGFGKKKTSRPETAETRPATAQPISAPAEIPMPPAQRNRDKGIPMTPIDEEKEFGDPAPLSPVRSPKLQRRTTPEWPLPPSIAIDDRPMSSDGVAPRRPRFAIRKSSTGAVSHVSAPTVDVQGRSVSYGRSGKKKKFQGLRRVFGLND
ncbi:MUC1 Extracellular alpha-14-glucan glucosidase [Pyrenophora seminiperda CCB06]|uniref:MUC1 Extracellular alpha-14-glucan glucosidase n=1 Tax=Pyrenophora seminiperda CCB06 TaxID=1302712 RepID=A0A3M7M644_9PLEO|nr:MUC1 Extracellular alpha-14-glucan glucosidase [Pyrenophora seminiperda CCB06]